MIPLTDRLEQTVFDLWRRLEQQEDEYRFGGRRYPVGMCSFPFRLTGQGFFPGGDGLWRNESELGAASRGILPQRGTVFVGNDFGTLASFRKLQGRGYENVPTWRHIKARIASAKIPSECTFFTNAIVGLREDGTALDKRSWQSNPKFATFCSEYLQFQLDTLKPRLVVVMGPDARIAFESLANASRDFRVLFTRHPYADFSLERNVLETEIDALERAWHAP